MNTEHKSLGQVAYEAFNSGYAMIGWDKLPWRADWERVPAIVIRHFLTKHGLTKLDVSGSNYKATTHTITGNWAQDMADNLNTLLSSRLSQAQDDGEWDVVSGTHATAFNWSRQWTYLEHSPTPHGPWTKVNNSISTFDPARWYRRPMIVSTTDSHGEVKKDSPTRDERLSVLKNALYPQTQEPSPTSEGFEEWWRESGKLATGSHIEDGMNFDGRQLRNSAHVAWHARDAEIKSLKSQVEHAGRVLLAKEEELKGLKEQVSNQIKWFNDVAKELGMSVNDETCTQDIAFAAKRSVQAVASLTAELKRVKGDRERERDIWERAARDSDVSKAYYENKVASLQKQLEEARNRAELYNADMQKAEQGEDKYVLTHVYPPIPARNFDWKAIRKQDEGEENAVTGWGSTKEKAIRDLKMELEARE